MRKRKSSTATRPEVMQTDLSWYDRLHQVERENTALAERVARLEDAVGVLRARVDGHSTSLGNCVRADPSLSGGQE